MNLINTTFAAILGCSIFAFGTPEITSSHAQESPRTSLRIFADSTAKNIVYGRPPLDALEFALACFDNFQCPFYEAIQDIMFSLCAEKQTITPDQQRDSVALSPWERTNERYQQKEYQTLREPKTWTQALYTAGLFGLQNQLETRGWEQVNKEENKRQLEKSKRLFNEAKLDENMIASASSLLVRLEALSS